MIEKYIHNICPVCLFVTETPFLCVFMYPPQKTVTFRDTGSKKAALQEGSVEQLLKSDNDEMDA